MAGVSMTVEIDDAAVLRLIRRKMARAKDLRPAQKDIGEYMVREREGWFQREESPEGEAWQPLKVRTIYGSHKGKKYTKKGKLTKKFATYASRRKILTRDHHLRRTVYRIGQGAIVVAPDKTSEAYAAVHQLGADFSIISTCTRVRIPARRHMGVTPEHEREFAAIVRDHLLEAA